MLSCDKGCHLPIKDSIFRRVYWYKASYLAVRQWAWITPCAHDSWLLTRLSLLRYFHIKQRQEFSRASHSGGIEPVVQKKRACVQPWPLAPQSSCTLLQRKPVPKDVRQTLLMQPLQTSMGSVIVEYGLCLKSVMSGEDFHPQVFEEQGIAYSFLFWADTVLYAEILYYRYLEERGYGVGTRKCQDPSPINCCQLCSGNRVSLLIAAADPADGG